ncbi:MAG: hypothetical protein FWD70_05390 [Desulfuromonadales bacterium]|nr:hypothetical protein [Desulfuromonadales bacterium]
MSILKNKMWRWSDVILLKWGVLFIGMIFGAYLREYVIEYIWIFVILAVICCIRPSIAYFKD